MNVEIGQRMNSFIEELTLVIGTLTQSEASIDGGDLPGARQWLATMSDAAAPETAVAVVIDYDRAALLGRLVSGGAGGVEDASTSDLLRNALTQAAAATGMRQGEHRLELRLETLEPRSAQAGWESGYASYAISVPGLAEPLTLAVGTIEAPSAKLVPNDRLGSRIDVILDIDLPVVVRFGQTQLPIRALSRLGPGSVIDLGRSPDDPVEVLVSNRVVARGEVVIVGGNYGVRILDVSSQSERARSMEA